MTEIARLQFQSSTVAEEHGALVLYDDGTFQIEPSEKFRDALAEGETLLLGRADVYGTRLGLGLIVFGTVAMAAGWYLGRAFGSLARNVIAARPLQDVQLTQDAHGGLRLRMRGAEHRWHQVTKDWQAGDFEASEATQFMQRYKEMGG